MPTSNKRKTGTNRNITAPRDAQNTNRSNGEKSGCRLNSDKDGAVFLRRDCSEYYGGVMTYETKIEILSADGLYFAFGTRNRAFLKIAVRNEKLFYNECEIGSLKRGTHYLKIVIDYSKKSFSISDSGKKIGCFAMTGELFAFNCLKIGFGYLDAVRSALCEDTPHTDVVPDEAQKARIGYLYPDSRRKLKRQGYDERPLPEKEISVRKLEFKTQEDLDKWEFRGMKNVRIEDGMLKGETTEPFAEMELKTVGWDASEISYLRVDCANKLYSNGEPQNIFLIPSNVPDKSNYCRENAARIWCNSLVPYEYRPLHLDNHAWWSGTIYGFKIIPVEHGTFELRSVTFFAALKHLCIYGSDNRPLFFGDYPAEHGKDIVIPLDPESGLYKTLGIKTYEWFKDSGTLELCTQKSRYTVVCGRAYAQKDEHDVMLSHPVMLKDAVPALYLDDICLLFDVKYERDIDKNRIRFSKCDIPD